MRLWSWRAGGSPGGLPAAAVHLPARSAGPAAEPGCTFVRYSLAHSPVLTPAPSPGTLLLRGRCRNHGSPGPAPHAAEGARGARPGQSSCSAGGVVSRSPSSHHNAASRATHHAAVSGVRSPGGRRAPRRAAGGGGGAGTAAGRAGGQWRRGGAAGGPALERFLETRECRILVTCNCERGREKLA